MKSGHFGIQAIPPPGPLQTLTVPSVPVHQSPDGAVSPSLASSRAEQMSPVHIHTCSYIIQPQPAMQTNTNQNQYLTGTTLAPEQQYIH